MFIAVPIFSFLDVEFHDVNKSFANCWAQCGIITAALSTIFVQRHSGDHDEDALTLTIASAALVEMVIINTIDLCQIMFK